MAVRFDPTITLGHAISFVGFMVAGFTAYSNLHTDIAVAQVNAVQQQAEIADNKAAVLKLSDATSGQISSLRTEMSQGFNSLDLKLEHMRDERSRSK